MDNTKVHRLGKEEYKGQTKKEVSTEDGADEILAAIRKRKQAKKDLEDGVSVASTQLSEYLDMVEADEKRERDLDKLIKIRRKREQKRGAE